MTVKKGDKVYRVEDSGEHWIVKRDLNSVEVKYSIDKALAPDAAALEKYILSNDSLF